MSLSNEEQQQPHMKVSVAEAPKGLKELANQFFRITIGLFGWAFGFGFWPQKSKAQPKGLLLEGAFSEAAAFP